MIGNDKIKIVDKKSMYELSEFGKKQEKVLQGVYRVKLFIGGNILATKNQ